MIAVSLDTIERKVAGKRRKLTAKGPKLTLDYAVVKTLTNEYGETITRVDGDIPVDLPFENGDRFLFISYDQSKFTHNVHKYPAKFFPELPRWLIRRYSQTGDMVLDPFCGSATTNLEAYLNGRHSVGVDVDPFAQLLAKVKTTPIAPDRLTYYNEQIIAKVLEYRQEVPVLIPDFPYKNNWFEEFILHELGYLNFLIQNLEADAEIIDFYRICFSAIIRSASNADDNCTRTVVRKKLNKKIDPAMALTAFVETVLVNTWFMEQLYMKSDSQTQITIETNHHAGRFNQEDHFFDLAVTSPPYVNAVDYPRTHQLELC